MKNGSSNGHTAHAANGSKSTKSAAPAWGKRPATSAKSAGPARNGSLTRSAAAPRKDARPAARTAQGNRKPALATGATAGGGKRFGFSAKQGTKKRG